MLAPGIQYVQVDAPKASTDGLRSDIAGFAGIFERGPILVPRRIEDWGEHRAELGGFLPVPGSGAGQALSPLALYGFFQNGGGSALVFRLGSHAMRSATATLVDPATGARVGLAASSPGAWANQVQLNLPLAVTMSRGLLAGFPASATTTGLQVGDIVRIFSADDQVLFGTLVEIGPDQLDLAAARGMKPPLKVEVIAPEVDVAIQGPSGRERFRGLSLRPEAPNNVWRTLARGHRGPEWEPEIPSAWLPVSEHLALACEQQGPGASRILRATLPEGWPDGPANTLPSPWPQPSAMALQSARGSRLEVVLSDGDDAFDGIDASVVQAAIRVLTRSPLTSILALPDLVLPLVRQDPPCRSLPPFDVRLPYSVPGVVEATALPASPKLPSYGSSFELLQEELLRAIWTTPEGCAERIALLDPPPAAEPREVQNRANSLRETFERDDPGFRPAASGSLFYPWIRTLDPASEGRRSLLVPPSGHVAGILARTSREGGAGARFANESIAGAVAPERALSDDERAALNISGIAAIHAIAGRGASTYGARTLSDETRPDMFLPAARVLAFVRRALRMLGETLVFEPNDALLLQRIRVSVDLLLRTLFRSGAFAGRTPAEAYAVRCDRVTTPPGEFAIGRVIAEVDIALSVPLEFITLRVAFSRDGSGVLDDAPKEKR